MVALKLLLLLPGGPALDLASAFLLSSLHNNPEDLLQKLQAASASIGLAAEPGCMLQVR